MKRLFFSLFVLSSSVNFSLAQDHPIHSIFLIGDAGEPSENPVLVSLKNELLKIGDRGTVIFLGDNIYPKGLPPKGHELREEAEKAINGQINAVKEFRGQKYFIPGNHDWAQGRKYGWDWLNIQEQYVEDRLDSMDIFLPSRGCPGPVEVDITDQITLIIFDTQWFLHKEKKPTQGSDCGVTSLTDAMVTFQDILERNNHKKVIVASHHPMYTYGIHGGVFGIKDHLFPLTASGSMKNFYLPLPVLGSIYPLYRKIFGNIQDTSHPVYKEFVNSMVSLMKSHPDVIHTAGHEHALEHIQKENINFIVSGSGSKNNARVRQKGDALFATNTMGFARVDYYADGKTELKFLTSDGSGIKELYSKVLSEKPFKQSPEALSTLFANISFAGRDTVAAASDKYIGRSKFHKSLLGENYRQEWTKPLNVPMFDIASVKGGLTPIKRGGGHQTISLRLEDEGGRQYVIRSMDKNPALTLPPELRKTFIKTFVQDGISASHPYAPFVVPKLADAAGIFHANPKLYYVPDDPRFGIYRKTFANTLVLFEERANKKNIDQPFFGAGDDVKSSPDLYEKLRKDNDNHVDEVFVARNRLFDFWLGDWDRHDDQWRWVEYKAKDDEKVYRPIPRDRDQVFFLGEGILKRIAGSKWAQPSFRGFEDDIHYMPAFGFYRIRWFDRYFLTEVSMEEWLEQARELKNALTDDVIESALNEWPKEIYDLSGDEILRKLKNRRDNFEEYARRYYLLLAKGVDIRGSDKREFFKVERLDDENTRVTVFKISKKGNRDKVLYKRTFKTSETKEIRLFGFDGEDEFEITGDVRRSVKVRIIGGADKDVINDKSRVSRGGKKTLIYDTKTGNEITKSKETSDKTSDKDPNVNYYNMEEFDFNLRAPLISASFNPDDGIFLGLGTYRTTDGFRKEPYASRETITFNYAFGTSSYNLKYSGDYIDVIGKADLAIDFSIKAPNFVNNFFGLGNDSDYNDDLKITFYRARFKEIDFSPQIKFNLGPKAFISLGSRFQTVEIEDSQDRFISDSPNNGLLDPNLFESNSYVGGSAGFTFDTRDNQTITRTGIRFNTQLSYLGGLNDNSANSGKWLGELSMYWSFKSPSRTTLATRIGFEHAFDDFEFFQSARLDGFNNLRGYRRFRFAGNTSFYHQLELRIKLFDWQSYILPSAVGLILFNDIGRVWLDGEDSDTLHHGFGGGLYVTPLNRFAINILMAKSEEGFIPLAKLGFYF